MARHFLRSQHLPNPADEREPRAKHTVGQAAISVLILWPFPLKYRHGFGRADLILVFEWILGAQILPFDPLKKVLAIEQLRLCFRFALCEQFGIKQRLLSN